MIRIRKSEDRGHADHGWLNAYHSFSFANFHDPEFMGFRTLRVINEDRIQPGQGFATHSHRDMEIVTFVLEGALEHKDNMNNTSVIRPGEIQRMTAGTGVTHSEFNHSNEKLLHLLQIWLLPSKSSLKPSYEQRMIEPAVASRLTLIASPDGAKNAVKIHQDAYIFHGFCQKNAELAHTLSPGRAAWIQVTEGSIRIGESQLSEGDGAAIEDESSIQITAQTQGHFLLFDVK